MISNLALDVPFRRRRQATGSPTTTTSSPEISACATVGAVPKYTAAFLISKQYEATVGVKRTCNGL